MTQLECPSCQTKVSVPAGRAMASCPSCGHKFGTKSAKAPPASADESLASIDRNVGCILQIMTVSVVATALAAAWWLLTLFRH